jgi:hypothetical protein
MWFGVRTRGRRKMPNVPYCKIEFFFPLSYAFLNINPRIATSRKKDQELEVLAQMHDMGQNYNDNRKQKRKIHNIYTYQTKPFYNSNKTHILIASTPFFFTFMIGSK